MPKILLADDNRLTRLVVRKALAQAGLTDVVEADDGVEALQAFRETPFDLVITDWHMPRLSGDKVLHAIRTVSPETPVIMLTAESERDCVRDAVDAGATDYIKKPFTPDTIRLRVSRVLTSGRSVVAESANAF